MSEPIISENDLNLRLAAGKPLFVLFYSQWCPYCVSFLPVFEDSAKTAPGSFLRACIDNMPDAENRYMIDVVPTVLYFRGGEVAARLDGTPAIGLTGARLNAFIASRGLP